MTTNHKRWRRFLKITAGLALAAGVLWGALLLLMLHWVAKPPPLPPEAATFAPLVETRGDRLYAGKSWLGQREGLPVLYLTGTPYEMGYANGLLTQELVHRQEDAVLSLLNRYVPQKWAQFLVKAVVLYKNRDLPQFILPEYQVEILGLSRGCPDLHPEVGPYYHRLLNYHGAQDVSYMLMNSPLLRGGCTSFGAWGSETQDGHLITARNFDWEADPVFDRDRLLIYCEPKDGVAFISLAWAGMAGCVSGMNREGISISVNGAPSHLPKEVGTPTCLVAREVLQRAHNLAEALDILGRRKVFVSSLFLVGSRKDGVFVVAEKTPDRMFVRKETVLPYIICANHYLTPELKGDELNERFMRGDTSVSRYERLDELLRDPKAPLAAPQCAAFLRDRQLPKGDFAGNGHRGSLNPLIATHSVIMDLTDGIFWAARPPHQLGRFVAFSIADVEKTLADLAIPADPFLDGGGYRRYLASEAELEDGWNALKRQDFARALECARKAEQDNPGFYRNSWLRAEGLLKQGKTNEAALAWRQATAGLPALAGERKKLEGLGQAIGASSIEGAAVLQTSKQ